MKNQHRHTKKGFTLVEMIVALGIFTTALFIATSAFLSVVNADRKTRATRLAIDNLNIALEDMTRKIKTGTVYGCGGGGVVADCSAPQSIISLIDQNDTPVIYKRGVGPGVILGGTSLSGCGDSLYRATQGCILASDALGIFSKITSPDLDVISLRFWVSGSGVWPNQQQPAVVIAIEGSLGVTSVNQAEKSTLRIQTVVTQRAYDH